MSSEEFAGYEYEIESLANHHFKFGDALEIIMEYANEGWRLIQVIPRAEPDGHYYALFERALYYE